MNKTAKAFVLILTGSLFSVLVAMLLYTTAPAQELGFTWGSYQGGEEFVSQYVRFKDTPIWPHIKDMCPGCFKTHEYIRPDAHCWYSIGFDLNPGYALDFWPKTSYVIITDGEGRAYQSNEWVISLSQGENYWSSLDGRGQTLRHGMMENERGMPCVLFRFNWTKGQPSVLKKVTFHGIQPRRLYE